MLYIFLQLILLSSTVFVRSVVKEYFINIVATLNLILFFNGLYLIRILIGLIQFFRPILRNSNDMQFSSSVFVEPALRLAGMVFLPFIFLFPAARKSSMVTLLISSYTIFNYTPNFISEFDTMLKCFFCISVFTATYSVLWFFKKLPSQTITE